MMMIVSLLSVASDAVAAPSPVLLEDEDDVVVVVVVVVVDVVMERLSNKPASANNAKSTTYFPIAVQHRGSLGDN